MEEDLAEKLLVQALAIVTGARRASYGTPEDNFATIAGLWQVYLERRFPVAISSEDAIAGRTDYRALYLSPTDVAAMMVLMKVARLAETPNHADSWRDIAGYAACGARTSKADLETGAPAPVVEEDRA